MHRGRRSPLVFAIGPQELVDFFVGQPRTIRRENEVTETALCRPYAHAVPFYPPPIGGPGLDDLPLEDVLMAVDFLLLHAHSIPRPFSSVKRSTFLCIPASFARFTALLRNNAEKSACEKRSRSDTGVARYASRGANAGWAAAGSPFQGQTSWQMSQPKALPASGRAGGRGPRCSIVA